MTSRAGSMRHIGVDETLILAALIPLNEEQCEAPLPLDDLEHIARSVCRYAVPVVGNSIERCRGRAVPWWFARQDRAADGAARGNTGLPDWTTLALSGQ